MSRRSSQERWFTISLLFAYFPTFIHLIAVVADCLAVAVAATWSMAHIEGGSVGWSRYIEDGWMRCMPDHSAYHIWGQAAVAANDPPRKGTNSPGDMDLSDGLTYEQANDQCASDSTFHGERVRSVATMQLGPLTFTTVGGSNVVRCVGVLERGGFEAWAASFLPNRDRVLQRTGRLPPGEGKSQSALKVK